MRITVWAAGETKRKTKDATLCPSVSLPPFRPLRPLHRRARARAPRGGQSWCCVVA